MNLNFLIFACSIIGRKGALRLVSLALLILPMAARAQIQQAWVARYNNGVTNGQHQALKMALGADGGIYVCGFSQNTESNLDYAVLRYAANGTLSWAARYDSTNAPQAKPTGFTVDSGGNSTVTGSAGTAHFDHLGALQWTAPYAGLATASDAHSNVFVTGYGTNFNTVKLNPQGSNLWTAAYQDVGPTVGQCLVVDSNGNAYISGSDVFMYYRIGFPNIYEPAARLIIAKYNATGSNAWVSFYTALTPSSVAVRGAVVDGSDSIELVSDIFEGSSLNGSFLVCKYANSGAFSWASFPDNGTGPSSGIALEGNAGSALVGQDAYAYNGTYSYYYTLFNLDPSGSNTWTRHFPEPPSGSSEALSVATAKNDLIVITGYSQTSDASNDIVTIAYDTNGKQLWLQRYDGPGHGDDEGNAIAVDNNGNVYVAGYDTPVGGGMEMVLIKYSPVTAKHEANGNFQLQAQGSANEPFDIQASTNLESWIDLGDFDADTNGMLQFTDTNAGLYPSRFYQAIPK